jgi:hypothetical protein
MLRKRVLRRRLAVETLERRQMLAGDMSNPGNALDVNNDLDISALDALVVINRLNGGDSGEGYFYDVSGDKLVTAVDALQIINALNNALPDVTLKLRNDTDHDPQAIPNDLRTFDLGLQGKVVFAGAASSLFIGKGDATWIDISDRLQSTGRFELDDAAVRAALGDLSRGNLRLHLSPNASLDRARSIELELLSAPPQPRLIEAGLNEDGNVVLDVLGSTYDPDSDPAAVRVEVRQQPTSGTLTPLGNTYVYRPVANFHGTDTVVYEVFDEIESSGLTTLVISVESVNDEPVLTTIQDIAIDVSGGKIDMPFPLSDADGDALNVVGFATARNPLAEIRDNYGLAHAGDDYFNLTGLNEKWLFGKDQTAFILMPNGDLVQWMGTYDATGSPETLIARLGESVYNDPSLLWGAAPDVFAPVSVFIDRGTISTDDGESEPDAAGEEVPDQTRLVVIPDAGLYGNFTVTVVVDDGQTAETRSFNVTIDSQLDESLQTLEVLRNLQSNAANLTLQQTPEFIEKLQDDLPAIEDPSSSQEITRLLELLQEYQVQFDANLAAAQRDNLARLSVFDQQIANLQLSKQRLEALQSAYATEWDAYYATRRPAEGYPNPNVNMAPIFVHGNSYPEPFRVYQGERLRIDFTAVHPKGFVRYEFNYGAHDSATLGHLLTPVHTGVFDWTVPETASGDYAFEVTAIGRNENNAELRSKATFRVEILPNQPTLESLTITPATISDTGTDAITLSANSAFHPRNSVSTVYYQDTNGNNAFDADFDQVLNSFGGDDWTGLPNPVASDASEVTFFARTRISTPGGTIWSQPSSVKVPVYHTPKLQSNLLASTTDETTLGNVDVPARQVARYGDGNSAIVSIDANNRLTLQRYRDVNVIGLGAAVGAPVVLGDVESSQAIIHAKSDSEGNVTILYQSGAGSESISLLRVSSTNETIIAPTSIATIENTAYGAQFTFDMNGNGEGVLAWIGNQDSPVVFVQTFTGGGGMLGTLRELNGLTGSYDGARWDTASVNAAGNYMINVENLGRPFNLRGNARSGAFPSVTPIDFQANQVAINSIGWTVMANADAMQLIDPLGRPVGNPLDIQAATGFPFLFDINFLSDDTVAVLRDYSSEVTQELFSLSLQPGLALEQVLVVGPDSLQAGGEIDVAFSVRNNSSTSYDATDVVFYLSRDETFDVADRLLGTVTANRILTSGTVENFTASINLSPSQDPYWFAGVDSLFLIASTPTAGSQVAIEIDPVSVDFAEPNSRTGDRTSAVIDPRTPRGQQTRISPVQTAADQNASADYTKSDAFIELIGYQFLGVARDLANDETTPFEVRDQIFALMTDVETSIETYQLKRFRSAEEKASLLLAAEFVRDTRLANAQADEVRKLNEAKDVRDQVVLPNQKIIADARASIEGLVTAERERINSVIDELAQDVENRVSDINQKINAFNDLVFKPFLKPSEWQDYFRLDKLIEMLDEQLERVKSDLRNEREKLTGIRARITERVESEIAYQKSLVTLAETTFNESKERFRHDFNRVVAQAGSDFEKAKKTIEQATAAVGPVMDRVGQVVTDQIEIIQSINSLGDLFQKAKDDAQAADEQNPFGSVQQNIDAAESQLQVAKSVLDQLNDQLAPFIDAFKQAGGELSEWSKETGGKISDWTKDTGLAEWAKDSASDVLDQEVIAYKAVTDFTMSLNLTNAAFYLDAKVGPGVGYDSRKLNELLESGSPSIPDIDPVDAIRKIFSARIVQEDNYDFTMKQLQNEFDKQSVYLSSRRFVDHFGAESAAEIVVEAILFGGSNAAKDAIADIGEHIRLELNDIMGWLEQRATDQIEELIPEIVRSFLTGQNFRSPHIELRWTPIDYTYTLKPEPLLGKLVDAVGGNSGVIDDFVKKHQQSSRHAGFALIWQIPDAEDPEAQINAYLDDFEFGEFDGPSLTPELIAKAFQELVNEQLPDNLKLNEDALKVLNELGPIASEVGKFEKFLAETVSDVLGFDTTEIRDLMKKVQNLADDNFVLDFKDTPAADRLGEFMKKITTGNQRSAKVTEFSFDLKTFTLIIKGTMCHQHSWGTIGDILEGIQSKINGS